MKTLITIGDAAELCGVHVETIRDWERRGYLFPHRTPGGHRRYDEAEIKAWLEVAKNPCHYIIQYETYRPLPSIVHIFGDVYVGEETGGWMRDFEEMPGFMKLEIARYHKSTKQVSPMFQLSKKIILKDDKKDTGIFMANYEGSYAEVLSLKDGDMCLSTRGFWLDKRWPILGNRETMPPNMFWSAEIIEKTVETTTLGYVYYERDTTVGYE